MPLDIVHALAQVKRAAAEVNGDLGLLGPDRATAIAAAATHIAALFRARPLLASLAGMRAALRAKAKAFTGLLKVGRTHLQDTATVTFGQQFGGYDAQLALAVASIQRALTDVHALAIGGTAVGTGLNTHPEFRFRVAAVLARRLDAPFVIAP